LRRWGILSQDSRILGDIRRTEPIPQASIVGASRGIIKKHSNYTAAFNAFQHLPALYCGLRLSAINKIISMGCHKELLSFLRHIKDFWYYVFNEDESAMKRLDEDTLKAPGACEKEARSLGCIFGGFNETTRNRIWLRLCSATADCLVPSLYAFFKNLKYLQAAADCMRRLVPRKTNPSISMRRSFKH
ncbi:hypothetical protein LLEC1_06518, partial [Akanthomyces lecanii]